MSNEQWYTNKDLFEKIMEMQNDFEQLRYEMRETREVIRKYNGLREDLGKLQMEVANMKAQSSGKSTVAKGIRDWGGWIVAILMLVINIIKL